MSTQAEVKPLGMALREAREAGGLSLFEAAVSARTSGLVHEKVSAEKIRRLETGNIAPETANPLLVEALCEVYGIRLKDLAPDMAEWLFTLRDLLLRQLRCTERPFAAHTYEPANLEEWRLKHAPLKAA